MSARLIDVVAVKGRSRGVPVYELIGENENIDSDLRDFVSSFSEAVDLYVLRKWDEALQRFSALARDHPGDRPSKILLERCLRFSIDPPPQEWSGVITMREK
jgi:adenylate cyclase